MENPKVYEFPTMILVQSGPNTYDSYDKDGEKFDWVDYFQELHDQGKIQK